MAEFVPGLELARAFYQDVLAGIIGTIPHAAALLGEGSEVLGFDSERSTDHAWGPRAQIFVAADAVESLRARMEAELPETFQGWPVRFFRWQTKRIEHHVEIGTLGEWLTQHLGFDPQSGVAAGEWLATPQQLLLEVTSGIVLRDDTGALERVRATLSWYPQDIWLWLMASAWHLLEDKEPLIGRTAELGDALGARMLAARIAHDAIRLCFLQERRYMPYAKWLGSAFARLGAAAEIGPLLDATLSARTFGSRERALQRLLRAMARRHNALGVTAPLSTRTRRFEVGINDAVRPYHVLDAGRFTEACLGAITDQRVRHLPVVGSIDQLADLTDLIRFTEWPRQFGAIYKRQLDSSLDAPEQSPVPA